MGKIQTSFFGLAVLGTRDISNYILLREGDDFDGKPTVCHISHDYFNKLSIIAVDKNSWIFNIPSVQEVVTQLKILNRTILSKLVHMT